MDKSVKKLRKDYPQGTVIRCIKMDDPYRPVPAGTLGTVGFVDDAGTIHVNWENGQSLGLIAGVDLFEIVSQKSIVC